jgi:hypothetical protein
LPSYGGSNGQYSYSSSYGGKARRSTGGGVAPAARSAVAGVALALLITGGALLWALQRTRGEIAALELHVSHLDHDLTQEKVRGTGGLTWRSCTLDGPAMREGAALQHCRHVELL